MPEQGAGTDQIACTPFSKTHYMLMERITTEILILGTGLAGMRAALAALAVRPNVQITLVSAIKGPSGSSFANQNNALGMQVHETDSEREAFCRRALEIAPPGGVEARLVEVLAAESLERFQELEAWGLRFQRHAEGRLQRHAACFTPNLHHACIFTDLARAYTCFRQQLNGPHVRFMEGFEVERLLTRQQGGNAAISGARLRDSSQRDVLIQARAVVMALGGPAGRFRRNLAPAGNTGRSWALLAEAGAAMLNTDYIQYMWHTLPDRRFVPVARLAGPAARVRHPATGVQPLPAELYSLASARGTHCPVAYHLEDARIDAFLSDCQDADGTVTAFLPDNGWWRMAAMAHAGNGGARIDEEGRTNLAGLYCAGECAAGMHGANRIGGGMVLATQVFGRRAGLAAVRDN